jgi:hypothetical protein
MPKLDDYNRRAPEYKPGDLVQVKRHTEWARLTDSHRLGKVERVEPSRMLVRLKHASFLLSRDDLVQS